MEILRTESKENAKNQKHHNHRKESPLRAHEQTGYRESKTHWAWRNVEKHSQNWNANRKRMKP